jgi:hypothetical protein
LTGRLFGKDAMINLRRTDRIAAGERLEIRPGVAEAPIRESASVDGGMPGTV